MRSCALGSGLLRTELKERDPPEDVQETMNKVVKAENEKVAAVSRPLPRRRLSSW